MKKNKTFGFTLIEILVVATVIGLLSAVAATSYNTLNKNSRDSRRKSDLEQIRAALEMYRSNNVGSTYPASVNVLITPPVYIQNVPTDPKDPDYEYYYTSTGSDYTVAAQLEGTSTCTSAPPADSCGTGLDCNYCLGPYGKK